MSPQNEKVAEETLLRENNNERKSKFRPLPEKRFEIRNSLLTDLCETNSHIKTVQHIFIATLVCLFVNTLAHDYLVKGELKFGLNLIYTGFRRLDIVIYTWLGYLAMTILCYICFQVWAQIRLKFPPKSSTIKFWDNLSIACLLGYYVLSFQMASLIVTKFRLPAASSAIVVIEQVRLLMKFHAFMRHNAEKVVNYKPHSDQDLNLPSIYKYIYFLFAPTLVYRDEYPRTKNIRWKFVMYRFFEIAGVIFYHSFIFQRLILPVFEDFGKRKFTWNEIIMGICETSIPGVLIFVSGFYLLLHAVQNIFAELLCFGDRMFYTDWWTCTSFSEYFRKWNIVVHDWLYTYVYKDVYEWTQGNKMLGRATVFLLSAVVHEWALTHIVGFFFPLLFVEFVFGGAFLSLIKPPKHSIVHVLFWYGLIFGSGSLLSLYSLEYHARVNSNSLSDYKNSLLPTWLTCDCFV